MKNEPRALTAAGRWVDYAASGDKLQPLMLMTERGGKTSSWLVSDKLILSLNVGSSLCLKGHVCESTQKLRFSSGSVWVRPT